MLPSRFGKKEHIVCGSTNSVTLMVSAYNSGLRGTHWSLKIAHIRRGEHSWQVEQPQLGTFALGTRTLTQKIFFTGIERRLNE